ncbi:hypothetical protein [Noviherbaspirillum saxi]|uniref:Uncharacterized protein n=1 Tax=Noviherbaspirillum saxi TaxID=2320863 RepID=A0A3A3G1Q2_9BURK|nr:hypothetical protein [Noviherbaspirillum saxi]RJF92003.1 hypothetical protein D3871_25415 [Noviherbaspirillum saxi]
MASMKNRDLSDVSLRILMTAPFEMVQAVMKTSDDRVAFPFDSEAPGGLRLRLKPSRPGSRHFPEGAQHFSKPPRSAFRTDHVSVQPASASPTLPSPLSERSALGFESPAAFLRKHLFVILSICAAASVVGAAMGFYFAWSLLPLPMQAGSTEAEHDRPATARPSPSDTIAIRIAEMRRIASEDSETPADQEQLTTPGNSSALTPLQNNGSPQDASALRMPAIPAPDRPCTAASMALALCGKSPP